MEKNIECEIVQDLLIGYADNVLNLASKKLVEEHLLECEKCKQKLEEIKNDVKYDKNSEQKEIEYLKKVKKNINKKNKILRIIGIALAISIILNALVFNNFRKKAHYMQIFLMDGISDEELYDIKQTIELQDSDAEIEYCSKQHELEKMKEKFKENANLLDSYGNNLQTNPFPASFVVKAKINKIKDIEYSVLSMPGVKTVMSNIDSNPYELFIGDVFIEED